MPRMIIVTPIHTSKICQVLGFSKQLVSLLAPKPKLKKNAKDAVIAPSPKRWASENWVDIEPSIITVSK